MSGSTGAGPSGPVKRPGSGSSPGSSQGGKMIPPPPKNSDLVEAELSELLDKQEAALLSVLDEIENDF